MEASKLETTCAITKKIKRKIKSILWSWKIEIGITFGIGYILLGALLFWVIEADEPKDPERKEWNYGNAVYFCVITLTTIGYGDIVPVSILGRWVFIVYVTIGLSIIGMTVAAIAQKIILVMAKSRRIIITSVTDIYYFLRWRKLPNTDIELDTFPQGDRPRVTKAKNSFLNSFVYKYIIKKIFDLLFSPTSTVGMATTFLLCLLLMGASIFMFVEETTYLTALYFCFVTITTIGYGDIVPITTLGKVLVSIYAFLGMGMLAVLIAEIGAFYAEMANKRIRDEEEKEINKLDDRPGWVVEHVLELTKKKMLQLNFSEDEVKHTVKELKDKADKLWFDYLEDFTFSSEVQEVNRSRILSHDSALEESNPQDAQ